MANKRIPGPISTDYVIAFRPLPDEPGGPNAAQRVRMLLKYAGRALRLRALTVGPGLPAELPAPPAELDPCRTEPPFAGDGHGDES